jgi:hypothetical protein
MHDIALTDEESAAIQKALHSYLSDLRAEIVDTDNWEYKRELRAERSALESVVAKLDEAATASTAESGAGGGDGAVGVVVRVIGLRWTR